MKVLAGEHCGIDKLCYHEKQQAQVADTKEMN